MLVLFDIDGTLILSGRAGVRGMNRSFERLFGVSGALDRVDLAGRTDRAIVSEALRSAGLPLTDESIERVRGEYYDDLRYALGEITTHPAGVLPGVMPLLDALDLEDVAVGLLTGNFEKAAAIKLGHYGLWDRFEFGAYGDHHVDRRHLVKIAVEAAVKAGHARFEAERIVVIGDTPLDVDCAHAYGARAVAVATGPFSQEVLAQTNPAMTVSSLEGLSAQSLIDLFQKE